MESPQTLSVFRQVWWRHQSTTIRLILYLYFCDFIWIFLWVKKRLIGLVKSLLFHFCKYCPKFHWKFVEQLGISTEHVSLYMSSAKEAKETKKHVQKIVHDPRFDTFLMTTLWQLSDDRYAVICLDVSEKIHLEKELERKNKVLQKKMEDLDNALAIKTRFLATMSHGEFSPKFLGIFRLLPRQMRGYHISIFKQTLIVTHFSTNIAISITMFQSQNSSLRVKPFVKTQDLEIYELVTWACHPKASSHQQRIY